ncbi:MAG TPA: LPS export ABC transporter periplasmic protein LptC [Gemmatimonadales bacterium]|nr:LPS export ABC transporter periplasmic protein LptC [Gemmatimonadales bacterium]
MTARAAVLLCVVSATCAFTLACDDNALRANTSVTEADTADQVLDSVYHVITRDGVKQSIVEADTAYFYEASKVFELRGLRVTFFDAQGAQTSVLTAREGTYRSALGEMEGRHDVVVRSTDGRTLTTEILKYDQDRNELSTDQPFRFTGPGVSGSGVGFVSDPDFRNVTGQQGRGVERNGGGAFVPPGQ